MACRQQLLRTKYVVEGDPAIATMQVDPGNSKVLAMHLTGRFTDAKENLQMSLSSAQNVYSVQTRAKWRE